jgi:long-chain acyl-CoA synthetase
LTISRLDSLLGRIATYGERLCFVDEDGEADYNQLLTSTRAWRDELTRIGVVSGSVVALRADFSLRSTALLLALFAHKAVVVLVSAREAAEATVREVSAEWLCELLPGKAPEWRKFEPAERHKLLLQLAAADEGGIVIFTSGSSGKPKAALQSVSRFLAKYDRPGKAMITLPFLLFDHVAGMDTLFYTISNGGTLVPTRRRDPRSILDLIEANNVEVLPASPSFLRLLCLETSDERAAPSLKVITYGSEPMDPSTLGRLRERFPNAQLSQKYGTTETGSPRTVSRASDSLWVKLEDRNVESRVVDGILWIKSEGNILGYLNAPAPVDSEGWYCTGDRVETDGPRLRFLGRDSDVINVGGDKVAPAEVEQVILELPFVQEAVVRGESHPMMGQIVVARVVVREMDASEAARSIRMHCASKLARYKVPVKIDMASTSAVGDRHKAMRNGT